MKCTWTVMALAALAAVPAWAQVTVAVPESDAANYRNDVVKFEVELAVKTLRLGDEGTAGDGCVTADTELYGLGKVLVAVGSDKKPEERALFRVNKAGKESATCSAKGKDKDKAAAEGAVVALAPNTLSTYHERRGFTFGALTVPFKYQLRGDRGQSGGAALGGYIGGRFMWSGMANQFITFVGLTKVDVPVVKEGKAGNDQIAGVSYGLGMLTTIKGSFQAGIVLGFDHVPRSAGYAYNDKPWLSVSLGSTFTN